MALQGVMDVLKKATLKEIGIELSLADILRDIQINGTDVKIVLFSPNEKYYDFLKQKAEETLKSIGATSINVEFTDQPPVSKQQQPPPQQNPFEERKRISNVKKVIAVSSGKGGVGKSTVAVNLAAALKQMGYNVGYLDADMYGPSGPTMLGAKDKHVTAKKTERGEILIAPESHGIKLMSIGLLLPSEDTPVIWRGPVLFKALNQFLFDIDWGDEELDFLIIDLPPGTGDVQITLGQVAEIDGAIIVTTPQDVALIDVKKGIQMFNEVEIPVLGIVENMSYFICPETGKAYEIFGKSKTEEVAKQYNTDLIGKIPIEPKVAEFADLGIPVTIAKPDSDSAKAFIKIAENVINKLSKQ